ncbi:MAG TPA: exopolysaccharide biosynthesis protein [Candidatus Hydrogenedentes bacterium]|nr:exopolysaccharide biosynthesis protein [Candidatus Hydrogenedentota bacterium]
MRLSENIESIFALGEDGAPVTIKTIMDRVSVKSFGVLLAILALPSALPVPAPGYSVPGGIALVTLGLQIILRRDFPWLPQKVLNKQVRVGEKPRLIKMMVFFLRIFEFFIRPRLAFIFTNPVTYRVLGAIVALCGLSMCIPIPLTNTAPAFGVFVIGLSMLEEDGLLSVGGVLCGIIGLCLSLTVLAFVAWFGLEGADILKDLIKGLLQKPEPEAMVKTMALLLC